MTETMPQQMVIGLLVQRLGLSPGVRPWAIWTLPEAELEEFLERLTVFVDEYNDTYAVTQNEVVWRCWPKHRALVNELAVLFVMWLDATQGALSSAEKLATWHEKWLPGFQKRLAERWFGTREQKCTAGSHVDWRVAARAVDADRATGEAPDLAAVARTNRAAFAEEEIPA